jgi:cell division GTPase FtsZ
MPAEEDARVQILGAAAGQPLKTAIVGCGGTGCNMFVENVVNITGKKIALSSEPEIMKGIPADEKVLVNSKRLECDARAIIAGSRLVGTEIEKDLASSFSGTDMVFLLAGLGGCTGGWGAALASRAAKLKNIATVCVASEPFSVEGAARKERAHEQVRLLMEQADCTLVVPNDMILQEAPNLPIARAFSVMNSVLASPVNLLAGSVRKEDIKALKGCFSAASIFAMDSAEWRGDNAPFAIAEQLAKSRWLGSGTKKPKAAILLVEGQVIRDDLAEMGKEFLRISEKDAKIAVSCAGQYADGLRVTALVGF